MGKSFLIKRDNINFSDFNHFIQNIFEVPVFVFGEHELFDAHIHKLAQQSEVIAKLCVSTLAKLKTKSFWLQFLGAILANLHFAFIIFTTLPKRRALTTVVGKPISVSKIDGEPSQEQIDKLHEIYISELTQLFEQHKEKYLTNKEIKLEII